MTELLTKPVAQTTSRELVERSRRSELVLAALSCSVGYARLHTRFMLTEWSLSDLAETVELVVSELMTNAVKASEQLARADREQPTVQLWLTADDERALVQVWDGSNELPEEGELDTEAESGRGLVIVRTVCENYGVFRLEGGNGKIVWARVTP